MILLLSGFISFEWAGIAVDIQILYFMPVLFCNNWFTMTEVVLSSHWLNCGVELSVLVIELPLVKHCSSAVFRRT